MGVAQNWGTLFWGPHNKDPTIQGAILGSPMFGNSHMDPKYYTITWTLWVKGGFGALTSSTNTCIGVKGLRSALKGLASGLMGLEFRYRV